MGPKPAKSSSHSSAVAKTAFASFLGADAAADAGMLAELPPDVQLSLTKMTKKDSQTRQAGIKYLNDLEHLPDSQVLLSQVALAYRRFFEDADVRCIVAVHDLLLKCVRQFKERSIGLVRLILKEWILLTFDFDAEVSRKCAAVFQELFPPAKRELLFQKFAIDWDSIPCSDLRVIPASWFVHSISSDPAAMTKLMATLKSLKHVSSPEVLRFLLTICIETASKESVSALNSICRGFVDSFILKCETLDSPLCAMYLDVPAPDVDVLRRLFSFGFDSLHVSKLLMVLRSLGKDWEQRDFESYINCPTLGVLSIPKAIGEFASFSFHEYQRNTIASFIKHPSRGGRRIAVSALCELPVDRMWTEIADSIIVEMSSGFSIPEEISLLRHFPESSRLPDKLSAFAILDVLDENSLLLQLDRIVLVASASSEARSAICRTIRNRKLMSLGEQLLSRLPGTLELLDLHLFLGSVPSMYVVNFEDACDRAALVADDFFRRLQEDEKYVLLDLLPVLRCVPFFHILSPGSRRMQFILKRTEHFKQADGALRGFHVSDFSVEEMDILYPVILSEEHDSLFELVDPSWITFEKTSMSVSQIRSARRILIGEQLQDFDASLLVFAVSNLSNHDVLQIGASVVLQRFSADLFSTICRLLDDSLGFFERGCLLMILANNVSSYSLDQSRTRVLLRELSTSKDCLAHKLFFLRVICTEFRFVLYATENLDASMAADHFLSTTGSQLCNHSDWWFCVKILLSVAHQFSFLGRVQKHLYDDLFQRSFSITSDSLLLIRMLEYAAVSACSVDGKKLVDMLYQCSDPCARMEVFRLHAELFRRGVSEVSFILERCQAFCFSGALTKSSRSWASERLHDEQFIMDLHATLLCCYPIFSDFSRVEEDDAVGDVIKKLIRTLFAVLSEFEVREGSWLSEFAGPSTIPFAFLYEMPFERNSDAFIYSFLMLYIINLAQPFPSTVRLALTDNLVERFYMSKLDVMFRTFISPAVVAHEISLVRKSGKHKVIGTHSVMSTFKRDEISLGIEVVIPREYPLKPLQFNSSSSLEKTEESFKQYMAKKAISIQKSDGHIADILNAWQEDIQKKLEGVEECPICYSVLHTSSKQLPKVDCPQCHHKFHSACLRKWFSSSDQATCPLCRHLF
eukprot:ANDGO_05134.mRNA.1 E3 ubiquitin-protein ligase listerin